MKIANTDKIVRWPCLHQHCHHHLPWDRKLFIHNPTSAKCWITRYFSRHWGKSAYEHFRCTCHEFKMSMSVSLVFWSIMSVPVRIPPIKNGQSLNLFMTRTRNSDFDLHIVILFTKYAPHHVYIAVLARGWSYRKPVCSLSCSFLLQGRMIVQWLWSLSLKLTADPGLEHLWLRWSQWDLSVCPDFSMCESKSFPATGVTWSEY